MKVKLGRLGSNIVLVDFTTGQSKVFNTQGKFLQDGFGGSPSLVPVSVLSFVQTGTNGVLYESISGREKIITNPLKALLSLRKLSTVVYPLQLKGRTSGGISYTQYIYCFTDGSYVVKAFKNIS